MSRGLAKALPLKQVRVCARMCVCVFERGEVERRESLCACFRGTLSQTSTHTSHNTHTHTHTTHTPHHTHITHTRTQFLLRIEVVRLYRQCLRAVHGISDEYYKSYLRQMVRDEFRMHKAETDEREIRLLVSLGQKKLSDMRGMITMAAGKSS